MACELTSNVSLDCRENLGGIKTIFLASATGDDISLSFSGGSTNTNGAVTGITWGSTSIEDLTTLGENSFEFQQPRQSASLTETGNFSEENGTAFYQSVLTMVINKLDYSKLNTLDVLGRNTKLVCIVQTNNDNYFLVGNETGAIVTSSTAESGTAFGDRNGLSVELTGFSKSPAYELILS